MQYDKIKKLGEGGNGVVYLAKYYDGTYYAIKELHRTGFTGGIRFKIEFDVVSGLNHPNIIQIKSGVMSPASGNPFYVMEYMSGGSLRDKIIQFHKEGNVFSQKGAIEVIIPVADALSYAHPKGIYHRDMKPENILFNNAGIVKVSDWGICRFADLNSMRLTMGGGLGTPPYCSPEQWNDSHNVDGRTDIFALGVIFYELLTGAIPNNTSLPPSKTNKTVTQKIDTIISKMIAPDVSYRYQNIQDVINAIRVELLG